MFKRAFVFLFILFLALFLTFSPFTSDVQIIQTMAVPVSNKTIVIDAGHGLPDEGAQNNNGVSEAKINLKIALLLQKLLESSGATVILTRSDDNAIYEIDSNTISQKKVSDIKNRVKIGNSPSADIFVSIHFNKIPQSQYTGWQTFFKYNDLESKTLATCIQNNLNETISCENKRVPLKLDNIYIMKNVEIPIALVECGFLSNPEEANLLIQDEYQSKLAWGIYDGIMEYFNSKK